MVASIAFLSASYALHFGACPSDRPHEFNADLIYQRTIGPATGNIRTAKEQDGNAIGSRTEIFWRRST